MIFVQYYADFCSNISYMSAVSTYSQIVEPFVTALSSLIGVQVLWKDNDSAADSQFTEDACRHTCPFCRSVKSNRLRLSRCMIEDGRNQIIRMIQNSPEQGSHKNHHTNESPGTSGFRYQGSNAKGTLGFYRTCHSGVMDYVYPVTNQIRYLGAFFLGPWKSPDHGLSYPQLNREYQQVPSVPDAFGPSGDFSCTLDRLLAPVVQLIILKKTGTAAVSGSYTRESKVNNAVEYIQSSYDQQIRADQAAALCNLSTSRFLHVFKAETGLSFSGFILDFRLQRAKELLSHTNMPIEQVAWQAGFASRTYFARMFRRMAGISPREYRGISARG